MGCGSSTAAGASGSMSKDPEDFYLEHLHFKKMHVPDFDDYLTDDISPVVNEVVDIVNEINSCIDDIKDAAVIVCGGFKADVDMEGIKDHDRVMVTLTKPDNTYPTAEEVSKLVADDKIAKAEQELHKAHKALMTAMEKTYVKLKLDPATNALSSEAASPEVTAFSKAVTDLSTAVGATYKVVVGLRAAGIPSAPTVRVRLIKFKFPNPDSDDYKEEPVSLFDVLKSKEAKNLYNAELTTAEALAGVTKAAKACEDAGVKVTFTLKKKKLVAKFADEAAEAAAQKKRKAAAKAKRAKAAKAKESSGGGEDGEEGGGGDDAGDKADKKAADKADDAAGDAAADGAGDGEKAEGEGEEKKEGEEEEKDEDGKPKDPKAAKQAKEEKASVLADKKAAVRKSVSAANSQLFKLNKAARNANGDINVAKALVVVFEQIKKKVMKLSGKDSVTGLMKVDPGFKVGMPEAGAAPDVKFDLGLKVDLPDFEDLDAMQTIEKLLPGQAKLVIDTLMGVKDRLVELLPKFKELADQVEEAVKQSEEVFKDPGTKIKDAFGDAADMMKIGKTIAAATGNMKIVATEPIKVIKTMAQSVSRLGDELSAAVSEVKAAFP